MCKFNNLIIDIDRQNIFVSTLTRSTFIIIPISEAVDRDRNQNFGRRSKKKRGPKLAVSSGSNEFRDACQSETTSGSRPHSTLSIPVTWMLLHPARGPISTLVAIPSTEHDRYYDIILTDQHVRVFRRDFYWLPSEILDQRWYPMGQQASVEIRRSQSHHQAYVDVLPFWVGKTVEDLARVGVLVQREYHIVV